MNQRKYLKLWSPELDEQQKKIDGLAWLLKLFRVAPPDLRKAMTFVGYPSPTQLDGAAVASGLLGTFGVTASIEDGTKA